MRFLKEIHFKNQNLSKATTPLKSTPWQRLRKFWLTVNSNKCSPLFSLPVSSIFSSFLLHDTTPSILHSYTHSLSPAFSPCPSISIATASHNILCFHILLFPPFSISILPLLTFQMGYTRIFSPQVHLFVYFHFTLLSHTPTMPSTLITLPLMFSTSLLIPSPARTLNLSFISISYSYPIPSVLQFLFHSYLVIKKRNSCCFVTTCQQFFFIYTLLLLFLPFLLLFFFFLMLLLCLFLLLHIYFAPCKIRVRLYHM